jgi:hypothetical protein
MTQMTARINHRVGAVNRGDLYDDPLDDMLIAEGLGEVTGGGTSVQDSMEIDYVEIEIDVSADADAVVTRIIEFLEEAGAPKSSKIILDDRQGAVEFGRREGLALYMNGTDLPDAVYESGDINMVVEHLDALLEGVSSFDDFWEGSTETALYAYGASFEAMKAIITPYVAQHPLCQHARIVRIA